MTATALLVSRLLIATMFAASAWAVFSNIDAATGYFAGLGMPLPRLVAIGTGIFEAAGSVLLIAGFQTRPAAVALALFSIAATLIGHAAQGDGDPMLAYMHQQALLKDVAVAGGLIALAIAGAGSLSLDARSRRQRRT